jgi:hypothetical protein
MKLRIKLIGYESKVKLYLTKFLEIREREPGTTLRHTFYQMLDMFEQYSHNPKYAVNGTKRQSKEDARYKYVCSLGKKARYNGLLDWDNIVDERRYNQQIGMYCDIDEYKQVILHSYKKDIWNYMPTYCAMLCEKDGMINILQPLADKYRMKLFSCAGQNSDSVNWEISQEFKQHNGGVIFYFGDWDAPGYFIPKKIKWFMNKVGNKQDFDVKFVRVSLNDIQVNKYHLKTIPSKKKFKTWIKKNGNKACEIDVLNPDTLIKIATRKISDSGYFDVDTFNRVLSEEQREIKSIRKVLNKL